MMLSISYAHYNFIIDINDNNQRSNTKGSTYSPFGIDVNTNFHLYIHVYIYILYLYMYSYILMCIYTYISIIDIFFIFLPLWHQWQKGYNKVLVQWKDKKNMLPLKPITHLWTYAREERDKTLILFLTLQIWISREVL